MSNLDETIEEMDSCIAKDYTTKPMPLTYDEVFTYEHLYKSAKKCLNGVRWKASTQNFEYHLCTEVQKLYNILKDRNFKSKGFKKFTITDRGKPREILSVDISERVVQKCLCAYYLLPLIEPKLIYDNGACLKGKGIDFTINRFRKHLHTFTKNNNSGYILLVDIKSFFASIDHHTLLEKMDKIIKDKDIFNLYKYFINLFPGDCGIGLGSQVSQISALYYLNNLDHIIKDSNRVKHYGRYMDDIYCLLPTKAKCKQILEKIQSELNNLHLLLNFKKVQIIPLSNEFCWLKRHWKITCLKISVRPHKSTIIRFRNKRQFPETVICFKAYLQNLFRRDNIYVSI